MNKRKSFQELTISDAFLFAAVMEDEEICRGFLQMVLETDIEELWVKSERVIGLDRKYRSVRLDIFADDRNGTMYDAEEDSFIKQMDARVQALKSSSGLEAEYMLFGELLDDERLEGQKEAETKIAQLVDTLVRAGKNDLLPKLKDPEFLNHMLKEYL